MKKIIKVTVENRKWIPIEECAYGKECVGDFNRLDLDCPYFSKFLKVSKKDPKILCFIPNSIDFIVSEE